MEINKLINEINDKFYSSLGNECSFEQIKKLIPDEAINEDHYYFQIIIKPNATYQDLVVALQWFKRFEDKIITICGNNSNTPILDIVSVEKGSIVINVFTCLGVVIQALALIFNVYKWKKNKELGKKAEKIANSLKNYDSINEKLIELKLKTEEIEKSLNEMKSKGKNHGCH